MKSADIFRSRALVAVRSRRRESVCTFVRNEQRQNEQSVGLLRAALLWPGGSFWRFCFLLAPALVGDCRCAALLARRLHPSSSAHPQEGRVSLLGRLLACQRQPEAVSGHGSQILTPLFPPLLGIATVFLSFLLLFLRATVLGLLLLSGNRISWSKTPLAASSCLRNPFHSVY